MLTPLPMITFSGKKGENIIILGGGHGGGGGGHGGGHGGSGMPLILITGGKKKKDETILIIFPQKPHHHHHFVPSYQDSHGYGDSYGGQMQSYSGGGHEMQSYSGGEAQSHGSSNEMYSTSPSGNIPYSIPFGRRPPFRGHFPHHGQPHSFSMPSSYAPMPSMMSESSSSPIIYGPSNSADDEESTYNLAGFTKRRLNANSKNNGPTIITL